MIRLSDRDASRLGNRLIDAPTPPVTAPEGEACREAPQPVGIDDATAAYVAGMREPFDRLRQAEAQLAGILVLAAASGRATAGHPMLALAAEAVAEAADEIRATAAPPRARHHHRHVVQAMRSIELAVAAARRGLVRHDEKAIDAVLGPLRAGHQHLLWATAALPGFEIVALSQACCARHLTTTNAIAINGASP